MKLIVGLGNPGREYAGTRHNIGFGVIARLSDKYHISLNSKEHKAVCGKGFIEGEKVILAQPLSATAPSPCTAPVLPRPSAS